MSCYKNILVAVDLNDPCDHVIERAIAIADDKSQVFLVSVMEAWNMLLVAGGLEAGSHANVVSELHDRLQKNDQDKIKALAGKYGLSESQIFLKEGKPAPEIKKVADEKQADLIVTGTHGKHGLELMLGSISNGILHGTPCDVLAVKV